MDENYITKEHCTDTQKLCEETFMSKAKFYQAAWTIVLVLIGLISGGVTWALSTSTDMRELSVKQEYETKASQELRQSIYDKLDRIDKKLDLNKDSIRRP